MLRIPVRLVAAAVAIAALIGGSTPLAVAQPGPPPGPAPGPGFGSGPGPAPGPAYVPRPTYVPGVGAAPAVSPKSTCADIEVIFARGTDDTPGLGTPGTAFVNALRNLVDGRSITTYAVDYPASYDFLAAADGAADATDRIGSMAQLCPTTRIVLGGYSQGAAVMDMLAGIPPLGNKIGSIGSAPPLPANLLPNIAAVAVFGNPATKFSNPITSSVFAGKAIDLCKDGDPICSDGRNPFAHNDYVSTGLVQQAASFVAGLV
ncbi:cutinase family protein [Mycobacterium sp. CPCC 205710]|uniref:Cutinase n=1 Tax=Mycobacterium deserti TaxID=2978347 RepID=A0ABT2M784_9MYCO|nr:cutinase family protein [Mycobacterium deserti]MCT7658130.1 cutinase family protein [Mycobacterium deserti]